MQRRTATPIRIIMLLLWYALIPVVLLLSTQALLVVHASSADGARTSTTGLPLPSLWSTSNGPSWSDCGFTIPLFNRSTMSYHQILVTSSGDDSDILTAIDLSSSGVVIWQYSTGANFELFLRPPSTVLVNDMDTYIVVVGTELDVRAFNIRTGEQIWIQNSSDYQIEEDTLFGIDDRYLYVSTMSFLDEYPTCVLVADLATGVKVQHLCLPSKRTIRSFSPLSHSQLSPHSRKEEKQVSSALMIILARDGIAFTMNVFSAKILWNSTVAIPQMRSVQYYTPLDTKIDDSIVFVHPLGQGTSIVRVDMLTGKRIWERNVQETLPPGNDDYAGPRCVSTQSRKQIGFVFLTVNYTGNYATQSNFTMLSAKTGKILWQEVFPQTSYDGLLARDFSQIMNDTIAIFDGAELHVQNAVTGAPIWKRRFDPNVFAPLDLFATPFGDGIFGLTATQGGKLLYILDSTNGTLKHVYSLLGNPYLSPLLLNNDPVVGGRTFVVPGSTVSGYPLDSKPWAVRTSKDSATTTPLFVGSVTFFVSASAGLEALDQDGRLIWRQQTFTVCQEKCSLYVLQRFLLVAKTSHVEVFNKLDGTFVRSIFLDDACDVSSAENALFAISKLFIPESENVAFFSAGTKCVYRLDASLLLTSIYVGVYVQQTPVGNSRGDIAVVTMDGSIAFIPSNNNNNNASWIHSFKALNYPKPIVYGDVVVVQTSTHLRLLSAERGGMEFAKYSFSAKISTKIFLYSSNIYFAVVSDDGNALQIYGYALAPDRATSSSPPLLNISVATPYSYGLAVGFGPVVHDDILLFGSATNTFYGFDVNTGAILWSVGDTSLLVKTCMSEKNPASYVIRRNVLYLNCNSALIGVDIHTGVTTLGFFVPAENAESSSIFIDALGVTDSHFTLHAHALHGNIYGFSVPSIRSFDPNTPAQLPTNGPPNATPPPLTAPPPTSKPNPPWYMLDGYPVMTKLFTASVSEPTASSNYLVSMLPSSGFIFVASAQGCGVLECIHLDTGALHWSTKYCGDSSETSDNRIFVTGLQVYLLAGDALSVYRVNTGIRTWKTTISQASIFNVYDKYGVILVYAIQSEQLVALSSNNGTKLWTYTLPFEGDIWYAAAGTVLALQGVSQSHTQHLHGLDLMTGKLLWKYARAKGELCSSTVVANRYFLGFHSLSSSGNSFGGEFLIFTFDSVQNSKVVKMTNITMPNSPLNLRFYNYLISGDPTEATSSTVYILLPEVTLLAVDVLSGSVLWNYTAKTKISDTTPLVTTDSVFVVASQQGQIIRINKTTGLVKYTVPWRRGSDYAIIRYQLAPNYEALYLNTEIKIIQSDTGKVVSYYRQQWLKASAMSVSTCVTGICLVVGSEGYQGSPALVSLPLSLEMIEKNEIWAHKHGSQLENVLSSGDAVFIPYDQFYTQFDMKGNLQWYQLFGDEPSTTLQAVALAQHKVLLLLEDMTLVLDADTGSVIKQLNNVCVSGLCKGAEKQNPLGRSVVPISDSNNVIFFSGRCAIHIDAITLSFASYVLSVELIAGTPILKDEIMYFVTISGYITASSTSDLSNPKWTVNLDSLQRSYWLNIYGSFLFVTTPSHVYCLMLSTGELVWVEHVTQQVSQPAIGWNDMLVVVSAYELLIFRMGLDTQSHLLYSIPIGSLEKADSATSPAAGVIDTGLVALSLTSSIVAVSLQDSPPQVKWKVTPTEDCISTDAPLSLRLDNGGIGVIAQCKNSVPVFDAISGEQLLSLDPQFSFKRQVFIPSNALNTVLIVGSEYVQYTTLPTFPKDKHSHFPVSTPRSDVTLPPHYISPTESPHTGPAAPLYPASFGAQSLTIWSTQITALPNDYDTPTAFGFLSQDKKQYITSLTQINDPRLVSIDTSSGATVWNFTMMEPNTDVSWLGSLGQDIGAYSKGNRLYGFSTSKSTSHWWSISLPHPIAANPGMPQQTGFIGVTIPPNVQHGGTTRSREIAVLLLTEQYSSRSTIFALFPHTGESPWSSECSESFYSQSNALFYAPASDVLIAICNTEVRAMDPGTGKLLWNSTSFIPSQENGNLCFQVGLAVAHNGTWIAVCKQSKSGLQTLVLLSPSNGKEILSYATSSTCSVINAVEIQGEGKTAIFSCPSYVEAIQVPGVTGQPPAVQWRYPPLSQVSMGPMGQYPQFMVYSETTQSVFLYNATSLQVISLNAATGALRWNCSLQCSTSDGGEPCFLSILGHRYLATFNSNMYSVLDIESGSILWSSSATSAFVNFPMVVGEPSSSSSSDKNSCVLQQAQQSTHVQCMYLPLQSWSYAGLEEMLVNSEHPKLTFALKGTNLYSIEKSSGKIFWSAVVGQGVEQFIAPILSPDGAYVVAFVAGSEFSLFHTATGEMLFHGILPPCSVDPAPPNAASVWFSTTLSNAHMYLLIAAGNRCLYYASFLGRLDTPSSHSFSSEVPAAATANRYHNKVQFMPLKNALNSKIVASSLDDRTSFFLDAFNRLYSVRFDLNTNQPTILWSHSIGFCENTQFVQCGTHLLISLCHTLMNIDYSTGYMTWEYHVGPGLEIATCYGEQVVAMSDGELLVLSLTSQLKEKVQWKRLLPASKAKFSNSPTYAVVPEWGVIAIARNKEVYVVSAKTGEDIWKARMKGSQYCTSVTVDSGLLFAICSGVVFAFDLFTGTLLPQIASGLEEQNAYFACVNKTVFYSYYLNDASTPVYSAVRLPFSMYPTAPTHSSNPPIPVPTDSLPAGFQPQQFTGVPTLPQGVEFPLLGCVNDVVRQAYPTFIECVNTAIARCYRIQDGKVFCASFAEMLSTCKLNWIQGIISDCPTGIALLYRILVNMNQSLAFQLCTAPQRCVDQTYANMMCDALSLPSGLLSVVSKGNKVPGFTFPPPANHIPQFTLPGSRLSSKGLSAGLIALIVLAVLLAVLLLLSASLRMFYKKKGYIPGQRKATSVEMLSLNAGRHAYDSV